MARKCGEIKYTAEQYRHWLRETCSDFTTAELGDLIVEMSNTMTQEQLKAAMECVWVDGPHIDDVFAE